MTAIAGNKVLIMAGGTGGHVFPALAVAKELLQRGYDVHWLGTDKGIEARVVPENNLPLHVIASAGVRGKGLLSKGRALLLMVQGFMMALRLIKQLQPVSVLGMGGYATVPGGLAAVVLRKPLLIQEQNSVAGSANRLLSRFASKIFLGFPNALSGGVYSGNPVRAEMIQLKQKLDQKLKQKTDSEKNLDGKNKQAINLLVIGGSLGAKPINEVLPEVLPEFLSKNLLRVWHQTGKLTFEDTVQAYVKQGLEEALQGGDKLKVDAFIDDMAAAYEWADLVLCRAGAISLAEIACIGLPAILVPLPHAIDDHQKKNADFFVTQGAALMLEQKEMQRDSLQRLLSELLQDRNRLLTLASQCRSLAKPQAAVDVALACMEAA